METAETCWYHRHPLLVGWLIVLTFVALYILPLGNRPLLIPDEVRYSQIPREMIAADTYFAPTFADMPYYEKPSGGYYAEIIAQKVLGESNFTTRIPYVLAAALTLFLTYILAKKGRDIDRDLPLFAVLALLTMAEFFLVSTIAVLDGLFTALITGVLTCFYWAWSEPRSNWRRAALLAGCGLFLGGAFIVKGFLAFALPGLAIVGFLLWMRDFKSFIALPGIILLFAAAVIVPWGIATAQAAPDFWRYFVVVEHLERFLKDNAAQHPQPFFFFIPVLLIGALPYSVLAANLIDGGRNLARRGDPLLKFCLAAVVLPFVFLSLSRGKLATYILPIFPELAILIVGAWFKSERRLARSVVMHVLAGIMAALAVALVVTQYLIKPIYAPEQTGLVVVALIAFLVGAGIFELAARAATPKAQLLWLVAAMLALMPAWQAGLPEIAARSKAPEAFLRSSFAAVPPEAVKLCRNQYLGALRWVTGGKFIILGSRGEFEYGLKNTSGKNLMSQEELTELLKNEPGKPVAVYSKYKHRKSFCALPRFDRMITNGEIALYLYK